ncbi:contractile injection system tape measure protein [Parapedobacter sp. 10938]|uniref:contractile injection system tape measure protein n=1 Tax=Parapedobacter flavus TaxID=3110225 RepID=UPI002DBA85EB|nr:contractile injection system tape measure protein [Parapedobacter sp. 10938]MEC3881884.1 contractile injection system tape measure protein [Parapedobacter sp. 10938]
MHHHSHIIHRQSLEVTFEGSGERLGIQDRLAEVYYEGILPELDQLFTEFSAEQKVVTIPELSIDCGLLQATNWEDELIANVCSKIRDELRRYPIASTVQQWDGEFIHFLQTGRFQWDSQKKKPVDYEEHLLLDAPFLAGLTRALQTSGDTLKRLFHYCTTDFIIRLAKALAKDRLPSADLTYRVLLEQGELTEAVWANAVVAAYYTAYCRPSTGPAPEKRFRATLTEKIWSKLDGTRRTRFVEQLLKHIATISDADLDALLVTGFLTTVLPLVANEFPSSAAAIRQHTAAGLPEEPEPIDEQDIRATAKETDIPMGDLQQAETCYYITNAGLVLVYPFIASLWQSMGFLDDAQQLFPAAKGKAATSLQYLAYESPTVADESELPLNKLLTGLLPTTFVDPSLFEPTAQVDRELETLLEALITHWKVLRNTTIAGLRETFLQREGKLTPQASGWLLQVDTRGVDVLLTSLPWPIGMIKLPWMDNILRVEWG